MKPYEKRNVVKEFYRGESVVALAVKNRMVNAEIEHIIRDHINAVRCSKMRQTRQKATPQR